jgi:ionotropic glutamate receptor
LVESSVNEYLNERSPCNTIKVGSNLDSKGYGIATPIDSELREELNLAILQLREEGFLEDLKTKWWYDRSECSYAAKENDSERDSLNLMNVAGIFYILIIGLALSFFTAALEMIYQARSYAQKQNILFVDAIKHQVRLSIFIKL